jgi:hypothetical protein
LELSNFTFELSRGLFVICKLCDAEYLVGDFGEVNLARVINQE